MLPGQRRPRGVYDVGDDPDPRFSLANERTLLAWLRTSLALVVAGVAVVALSDLLQPAWLVDAVASVGFVGGAASALLGYRQWWHTERAMRLGDPLPSGAVTAVVLVAVLAMAVIGAAAMVTGAAG